MTKQNRFDRLPHLKAWLPVGAISILLAVLSGLAGTIGSLRDSEFAFDQALNSAGGGALNALAAFASNIYSPKFAIILTIAVALLIWLLGKSRLDALAFGLTVAFGWLPAEAFKIMFSEPRANISGLVNQVMPQEVDTSFPSGHVCFALAFGFALYYLARNTLAKWIAAAFWVVSVLVEIWARLYVGAHYLNDVAGSFFTTLLGVVLFAYLWNRWFSVKLQTLKFFSK
jgi:undecaprenyl-diphosphatase